ncbi:S8/S53 family peptidase [Peijinzhouia sedimentorum]
MLRNRFYTQMRTKFTVFIILTLLCSGSAVAQEKIKIDSSKYSIPSREFLNQRIDNNKNDYLKIYADRYNLEFIRKNGQLNQDSEYLFYDLSSTGHPLFIHNYETRSGRVVKADQVYPLGNSGLRLTGKNQTIGVFDGGRIQIEHKEFQGRARMIDNVTLNNFHATHVSGIIGSAGINENARGIAYESLIDGYTFDSFDSKLIDALEEGLAISNHSYGPAAGWQSDNSWRFNWRWYGDSTISETQDYNFGFYADWAQFHDALIYYYPYHILVTSAGNTRSMNGPSSAPFEHEIFRNGSWVRSTKRRDPNGPYDSMPYAGVAKNIVTVGAVSANAPTSFSMANFSSWGPTDDGRIKPDLVGVGVGVFSTVENTNDQIDRYSTLQGTSMSSPNVAGGLLLIRQHFIQQHSYIPLASTVKGLAIHTARQHQAAGVGPNYRFGWGLLDVEQATNQITKLDSTSFIIEEFVLEENEISEKKIYSDGISDLKVTVVWTDPEGDIPTAALNPKDTILVNDIDLKVIAPDGSEFFPFILDPANPTKEATRGINYLDNTEVVIIENPMAGEYKIQISHKKNNLVNGFQIISLIGSGSSLASDFKNLYWIGGNGNWNDPNNWSESQNGISASRTPNSKDIVRFDNSSFQSKNQTVIIPNDAKALNLIYSSDSLANFDFSNGKLQLSGSFILTKKMELTGEGLIEMTGENLKFNGFTSAGNDLSGIDLIINSDDGYYEIEDSLTINSITLEKGILDLNNKFLKVNQIISQGIDPTSIDLRNAQIEVGSKLDFGDSTKFILADNSTITFGKDATASSSFTFKSPRAAFNKLIVLDGSLDISGEHSFKIIKNSSAVLINENTIVDSLFLGANSQLTLNDGVELSSNFLSINSSVGNEVSITGLEDGFGYLKISENVKYCFDFLLVNNVSNIGEATLNAGVNGQLTGIVEGWSATNCEDVLFADYIYENACLDGVTRFTSTSTGNPSEITWQISTEEGEVLISQNSEDLEFVFEESGVYVIALEISDGEIVKNFTQRINIAENPLKSLVIFEDNDLLVASLSGLSYQWFLDGELLVDATQRLYNPVDPGNYQVVAINGRCSFTSPIFTVHNTVVGIDDEFNDYGIIVFPNPATELLNIKFNSSEFDNEISISLMGLTGNLLWKDIVNTNSRNYEIQLPISQIPAGVYVLIIEFDNRKLRKKIIVD